MQVFEDFARMSREQNLTVVMVTHDTHAADYADDVYNLENRKLVKLK